MYHVREFQSFDPRLSLYGLEEALIKSRHQTMSAAVKAAARSRTNFRRVSPNGYGWHWVVTDEDGNEIEEED